MTQQVRFTVDGLQKIGRVLGVDGLEGEMLSVEEPCPGCGGSGLVACHSFEASYVETDDCSSCAGSGRGRRFLVPLADVEEYPF